MEILTVDDLRSLTEAQKGVCVSIFVPTQKSGKETQQAAIRLKNLLREGESKLQKFDVNRSEARSLLAPAQRLIQDTLFWQYQKEGLALFLGRQTFKYYRLPFALKERVVVNRRFYIKPLLRMFSFTDRYYILAVSQKSVRILECSSQSVEPVELENIPKNLNEVTGFDDLEQSIQFHTRGPAEGLDGRRRAIFHGHTDENRALREGLRRYLQQVDAGLCKTLGYDRYPLVFAGVDYLFPVYKDVTGYKNLVPTYIEGNHEKLRDEELRDLGWRVIEPHIKKEFDRFVARYHDLANKGKTSDNAEEIVLAAHNGRVHTLFVALEAQLIGIVDPERNKIFMRREDDPVGIDLLDYAASCTFFNGGYVYPVQKEEVPGGKDTAAIFRY